MNRQKLITILATITIMAILSVSLIFTQLRVTAYPTNTYDADGMTVNGVLASDSYVLFPFAEENLIFGFSKYGELINGEFPTREAAVGLEYDGLDVFANPNVLEKDWSQGWLIDIHYADLENEYKRAWAYALYSDLSGAGGIGGIWQQGCSDGPLGAPHGGRKTNVWATTDPIKVLYDGPRRFVALTKTTLYSTSGKTSEDALVSVTITFVFNKDKKQVTLFKDIKRLDTGKFGRTFQVEFSNRGEWDIGTAASPPSYAHFYDNLTTVYGDDYHDFYDITADTYNASITGYDVCQMINKAGTYVGFAAYWPQLYGKLVDGTTDITRSEILTSLCTKMYNVTWEDTADWTTSGTKYLNFTDEGWPTSDNYTRGLGYVDDEPMVFKNGILQSGNGVDYTWYRPDNVTFRTKPSASDYVIVVYKNQVPDGGGVDDMISHTSEPDTPYVIGEWCFDLENEDYKRLFRAVTMYGLTDRHDADDDNTVTADRVAAGGWSGGDNVIDAEVRYLLNETFNPFDLYDAVHKQEYRWLYKETIPETSGHTYSVELTSGLGDDIYQPNGVEDYWSGAPWSSLIWTSYNTTLISDGTFDWMNEFDDNVDAHSKNWLLYLNATTAEDAAMVKITPTGYGVNRTDITGELNFSSIVDFAFWYYALTGSIMGPHIEIELFNSTGTGYLVLQAYPHSAVVHNEWTRYSLNNISDYLGGASGHNADLAFSVYVPDDYDDMTDAYDDVINNYEGVYHSYTWWQERLGSFQVGSIGICLAWNNGNPGECYIDDLSVAYLEKASGIRYERVYNMEEDKLVPTDWDEYCVFPERVLVDDELIARKDYQDKDPTYSATAHRPYYDINFELGNMTFYKWSTSTSEYVLWDIEGCRVKVLYSTIEENEKGRYEWMVAGKDAATIDSIGAAYMTEAFDSRKDIEVQWTALDINDTVNGPYAPFVMGYGALTGTKADYKDSLGRPHLRDDWCTTTAISSSNMLFSGGPLANLGAEYFNEFTNAFWARPDYVVNDTGHASTILALSCWNKNNYTSTLSALYGYAVVSVYKDINGTIGFLIWGHEGQDTYYATKWFWDIPGGLAAPDGTTVYSGIEYLQHENRGVTDIILEIYYSATDPTHPSVSITERLGTISEKTPHDPPGI